MSSREILGDFQTPLELARAVCAAYSGRPATILEPTCGDGAFLQAAKERFPGSALVGYEIQSKRLARARSRFPEARLEQRDCFATDWGAEVGALRAPRLVLGNPPWVTSDDLTKGAAVHRAPRNAAVASRGMDAVTGASNFDGSEWLTARLIEALAPGDHLVMVLKLSVIARLIESLQDRTRRFSMKVYRVDARRWFHAQVEAAVLFVQRTDDFPASGVPIFDALHASSCAETWGVVDGRLVSDLAVVKRYAHLLSGGQTLWRSGVKHDCRDVMELEANGDGSFRSAVAPRLEVEGDRVFPLAKATDIARRRQPKRSVIVTQRRTGEDTAGLQEHAPKLWAYLDAHGGRLDGRRSRVYRGRPRFSIFGVGGYSFTPHKVAISGLHRGSDFLALEPVAGRPVLVDDTCYLLPCAQRQSAQALARALNSPAVRRLLLALTVPGKKRWLTALALRRLDIEQVLLEGGEDVALAAGIGDTPITDQL